MPVCPTCGQPTEPPAGTIIVTDAILPQVKDLAPRPGPVNAIVYHTTGRGLAKVAAKGGAPGTVAYDEAALAWYRRSGHPYFGAYMVGPSGLEYRLAPDNVKSWHAASLTAEQAAGRVVAPMWWRERWAPLPGPHALVGRSINAVTVGVDALPPGVTLWRGMLNWLGGLGIAFIAMIFLPVMRVGGMQYFRTEGFDTFGKALPRASDIAPGQGYLGKIIPAQAKGNQVALGNARQTGARQALGLLQIAQGQRRLAALDDLHSPRIARRQILSHVDGL